MARARRNDDRNSAATVGYEAQLWQMADTLRNDRDRPALDKTRLGQLIDMISNIQVGDEASRAKDVLSRVYDVFRPMLNPVLTGRSRPDLVGQVQGMAQWHAFECKARVSPPDGTAKSKAKAQAQRLVSVKVTPCALHVGAITCLRADALHFYWRDPRPENGKGIEVPMSGDAWMHYYDPVLEVVRTSDADAPGRDQDTLVAIEGADVEVGVHPAVGKHLGDQQLERAQHAAIDPAASIPGNGYQPDGLKVVAGESWARRFAEPGMAVEG